MSLAEQLAQIYAKREALRRQHNTKGYGDDPEYKQVFRKANHAITQKELELREQIPKATAEHLNRIKEDRIDFQSNDYGEQILFLRQLLNCDLTQEQEDKVFQEWAILKFNPPENLLDAVELPSDVRFFNPSSDVRFSDGL